MQQRHRPDRLELSRDLEVIADRVDGTGEHERAGQLRAVAAHLRAKATSPSAARPGDDPPDAPAYLLGTALMLGWLAVVLTVVALVASF